MRPSLLEVRLVFVRVNLLGLLGILVLEGPEYVVLNHFHRRLENWLDVQCIVSVLLIKNIDQLNQCLSLLIPELHFLWLFLRLSLEVGCLITEQ